MPRGNKNSVVNGTTVMRCAVLIYPPLVAAPSVICSPTLFINRGSCCHETNRPVLPLSISCKASSRENPQAFTQEYDKKKDDTLCNFSDHSTKPPSYQLFDNKAERSPKALVTHTSHSHKHAYTHSLMRTSFS